MLLRAFRIDDAERVAELVGDKSVSEWTANIPHPYAVEDAIEWIKFTQSNDERNPFAVEVNGEIVACVSFWPHDFGASEVGYWVGRKYWGKGIATEALVQLFFPDLIFQQR